jgi:hypothetical protein
MFGFISKKELKQRVARLEQKVMKLEGGQWYMSPYHPYWQLHGQGAIGGITCREAIEAIIKEMKLEIIRTPPEVSEVILRKKEDACQG